MKESNEKNLGPEAKDTPSMESAESKPTWSDLTFPCNLLLKEKDIAGVTENQPIQTIADAATYDNTFLRTFKLGWIKTEYYDIVEILPTPKPKEEP